MALLFFLALGCDISDEGAKALDAAIRENKGLQFLDLAENKISDAKKKRMAETAAANPGLSLQLM